MYLFTASAVEDDVPVAGRAATEARAPSPECSRGHYRGRVSNDEQPAAPLFRVLDYEGVEVVCTIERWGARSVSSIPSWPIASRT